MPFSRSSSVSSSPLQLIHSDIWGPAPVRSTNGCRYYINFIDEFSKFTWLFHVVNKADIYDEFVSFKLHVENVF